MGIVLALAAIWSPPARAAQDLLSKIRDRGELVWGGDIQGGEPYVFEDPKDPKRGVVGFETEIAAGFAARLGVRARFFQADWSTLVPSLERGDFDVALNGLEDTPSRRERILVSIPYFVFGETLAVRAGSSARSLDDLPGGRIGTLNQSYGYDVLKARGFEPALYEGVFEPYSDLGIGRADGVLLDHVIADRYGCPRKDVLCLPNDVARGFYIVGIPRGEASLKVAIDAALEDMTAKGELRAILERWKLWDDRQLDLTKPRPSPMAPANGAASNAVPTEPPVWSMAQLELFFRGALVTLGLSLAAFALALPVGLGLALARLERNRTLRFFASVYIEAFRGTPLLLQLYVIYFGLAPIVKLGPVTAAILGLGLNYAAYEAELHRGAMLAVPPGQTEAARSLGLGRLQTLRYVLLPQSFRIALPAMTNDFVALLKDSSLVSVLTVVELTKRMTIAAIDLRSWIAPGFACAVLYFSMSYPLARLAQRLERKLHRGSHESHG
jgi:polar amino acid transport system substrate-binding protein